MTDDIITTDKKVLTCPMWLYEELSGTVHPTKGAKLEASIDPDGDPIIGKEPFSDPDWQYLGESEYISTEGISKPLAEWFTEKFYKFEETEI